MEYKQFKQYIAMGITFPYYYDVLIMYSNEILLDVAQNSQKSIAEQLNITTSKFSAIVNILKAISSLNVSIVGQSDKAASSISIVKDFLQKQGLNK